MVSTFLWAQKEATLLNLKSPGEGEGWLTTERKARQPGCFTSFPSVLGPMCCDEDYRTRGNRASSAAQPVRFDASKLHTLQTLVLQLQVVSTLEEVAVT